WRRRGRAQIVRHERDLFDATFAENLLFVPDVKFFRKRGVEEVALMPYELVGLQVVVGKNRRQILQVVLRTDRLSTLGHQFSEQIVRHERDLFDATFAEELHVRNEEQIFRRDLFDGLAG